MNLSVRSKVFLTLLLGSLLAVVGTAAFVRWSVARGFMELLDARESARIDAIADRLLSLRAQDGSWERLRGDRGRWISALLGEDERLPRGRLGPGPQHIPPWIRGALAQPGTWPPPRVIEHLQERQRPIPLELRLMLLDESGRPVYGREPLPPGARRIPLELEGRPVGTLAVLPGPPLADLPDLQFQARQGGRLWVIVAGMVLISAALAVPLSHRLVRPVRDFQETAQRLAGGDYGARVQIHGGDEIARLGQDINALAAALGRNEQARRRWVADISHELRTPIALLRAELEALQDGVRPLDRAAVDSLHGDVLRIGRLVDDLYELSMTDLGALSYRMVDTNIGEVLESDLDSFRPRFEAAGLTLVYRDERPAPVPSKADPDRLSQLFRNLLRNSLQYTDPGGELGVRIAQEGDSVLLDFQDSAPGVPPEALPRLFDRLFRLDGSRSRNTGGAGLGLAIAKNIVEAHGGTIRAEDSPTGGLWIRITLPLQGAGAL